jgi:hypothetical protein
MQIASVQTLMRRELPPADLVFLDEAHLWFKYFRDWLLHLDWRDVPLIGLSATPWTRGLGAYYDELIYVHEFQSLGGVRARGLSPSITDQNPTPRIRPVPERPK